MTVPSTLPAPGHSENCVVILAPFGQDAALLARMLASVDVEAQCVGEMHTFLRQLRHCAAGLLTTEALSPDTLPLLQSTLQQQPPWSDIPLVLLSAQIDAASYALLARTLGNVTIIQRPLEAASLLTVVQAALRARRKQYQVRELLASGEAQQARIEALNQQLRRAMTEIHHRVKNNLQVIAAMVDMQIIQETPTIPATEMQRISTHIRTLALLHDLLTQNMREEQLTEAISVKSLLEKVLGMMRGTDPQRRLAFEIEEILLPVARASSLALVANELVSNGFKHGQSQVEVRFFKSGQKGIFEVLDNGSGFGADFDPQKAANTGLDLVQTLARHDLGGDVDFCNRPDGGACVTVRIPLVP